MTVTSSLVTVLGLDDASFTQGMRRAAQQTRDFKATQERELAASAAAGQRFSSSMRGSLGNVAQQVQDIAVQFQGGTAAAIIFAQQGPQIAGAFGPAGAAIGAVAAVAAVAASAFLGFGRDVDAAKAATDAMEAATKSLDSTIAGSASSVEDLARKYRVLSEEMRVIERLELGKTIRESETAISAALDQVETAVKAAESSGQLALLRQSEALARLDPGAARNAGVVQTQAFIEGMQDALASVRDGGSLTVFADQIDRLAKSFPEAGKEARDLADSFIAPARNVANLGQAITKAETALMALEGQRASGPDPFLDQAKAAEQAEKAVDKAAKASARAVAQSDRRQESLAREIENMRRLVEAGEQSAAAYEQMRRTIDAENKAVAAGLDPKGKEARILAELTAQIDAQTEARKRSAKAIEAQYRELEKFGENFAKRVDAMFTGEAKNDNRDVENLQRNLQQNVASAIERGFEDGFGSVGDLVDQFGSLLKSAVATSLADSLVTEALAKSIKGGLDASLGSIAPSLARTSLGSTTVAQAGGGALGAAFGGYAIGQQFAGNRPLGTLGGAAGGALLGTMIAPGIGTAIGAGIGGIAGYFGSGQTGGERNNNYQLGFDPFTGRPIEFQNTRPDPQNQQAVAAVIAEASLLRDGLRATGIVFGDIGDLVIQAGNKSGLTLNGEKYGSQSALNEAALRQLLSGATNLTSAQQTALANSQAKDAQGLLTDLAIPEQLANLRNPLTQFSLAMKEVDRVFREANDNAERLGLSVKGLSEAQERDRERLVYGYKVELGLISQEDAARRAIIERFREALKVQGQLGVSERELVAARDRQLDALREQMQAQLLGQRDSILGGASNVYSFLPSLQNFANQNAISGLSGGTKLDQFKALQAEYNRVEALASGGDAAALGQIAGLGQQYLSAAQGVYASGPGFARVEQQVTGSIDRLADKYGQLWEDNFAALIAAQDRTVQQQTAELVAELREVKKAFEKAGFADAFRRRAV